jgi:hypothetical protein
MKPILVLTVWLVAEAQCSSIPFVLWFGVLQEDSGLVLSYRIKILRVWRSICSLAVISRTRPPGIR